MTLQLERWRQEIVLNRKELRIQVDVLDVLESFQIVRLSMRLQRGQNVLLDLVQLAHLSQSLSGQAVSGSPLLQDILVRDDNGNQCGLMRITVHKGLSDKFVVDVDVLNLFWRDVLTLGQLEDVLLAIDNFQTSLRVPHTNIARMDPTITIQRLGYTIRVILRRMSDTCLVIELVIALEAVVSTETNFTTREWLILARVSHFRNIDQLNFSTWEWSSDVADTIVSNIRLQDNEHEYGANTHDWVEYNRGTSRSFGLTITFTHLTAKSNAHELHHFRQQRS